MPEPTSRLASFLSELQRRRVFRVAAVYAGVAFIISEIVGNTFDYLGIPDWFGTAVIVLLILGFPIAVALAWAFDITDKGIVRTKPKEQAATAKAPHPLIGNKVLAVIAVLAIAFGVWSLLREPSPGGAAIRSIAVLPLDNIGGAPEDESIVDGMHEALISELSGIRAIIVRGRQSTLQYRSSVKTIPAIASELDVDALIEGSIQLAGDRIRITTQLIDSQDRHLWRNTYERNLEDVFAIYDDVTRAITQEIQATLTPEEEARLSSAPQVNPEAYELYLKGWHFRQQETTESMPLAVAYLEQAVALDSTFARAWAALVPSYGMAMSLSGWNRDSTGNLQRKALTKALELDPDDVVALTWQGVTQTDDYNAATAAFRRALELEPGNVYARYEYGLFLGRWGRLNEGLAELRLAQELDPVNPLPPYGIAATYYYFRQHDQALEYEQVALELSPDMKSARHNARVIELEILMEQSRYVEAAVEAAKAYAEETLGRVFFLRTWLRAEGARENRENIYAIRDSLISIGTLSQQKEDNPWWYAHFYGILGEQEQALDLLELAYEAGVFINSYYRMFLVYGPEFDFLRAEPRFKAIMQKIEVPEVFDENGILIQPLDESLEAYNAPGAR